MTLTQVFIATILWAIIITITYVVSDWKSIKETYNMWVDKEYWTNYNITFTVSWAIRASIIIPGLIFGIQIWWFYFFSLATSIALIWASSKKKLPTIIAFSSLWVWLSLMVLVQHLF